MSREGHGALLSIDTLLLALNANAYMCTCRHILRPLYGTRAFAGSLFVFGPEAFWLLPVCVAHSSTLLIAIKSPACRGIVRICWQMHHVCPFVHFYQSVDGMNCTYSTSMHEYVHKSSPCYVCVCASSSCLVTCLCGSVLYYPSSIASIPTPLSLSHVVSAPVSPEALITGQPTNRDTADLIPLTAQVPHH